MAENEATGVAEQEDEDFKYPITVEDAGPGAKKVTVDVPRERISAELQKQFQELRKQAAIPGFRPGHAPQKLIQKRFSADVKEQVRRSLISQSYEQAVEQNKLKIIGEPEFVDRSYVAHHATATATGARLVHCCCFDSIPHDLGVQFTVDQLPEGAPLTVRGYLRAAGPAKDLRSALFSYNHPEEYVDSVLLRA